MKFKVFIVCSGVGHINRGYESFTRECFDALKDNDDFDLYLLKGGGKSVGREMYIPCIQRKSGLANVLSRLLRKETYWLEQLSFFFCMIPSLFKYRPSVIYYSDFVLGTWLWQLRRFLKFKYKLLFSNGAPNGPPFVRMDHVQQLLPLYFDEAIKAGTPTNMQTLLPYAFKINKEEQFRLIKDKMVIRKKLNLPVDKKIIISVGAVNVHHKRMDYVVKEFSRLPQQEYFLLIIGQLEEQTSKVVKQAAELLNQESFLITQVSQEDVKLYMATSDYFILASFKEGFGRVLPEALACGLLPIVHEYDVTEQVLGSFGVFKNIEGEGVLENAISEIENRKMATNEIIDFVFKKYSWESLSTKYVQMIKKC